MNQDTPTRIALLDTSYSPRELLYRSTYTDVYRAQALGAEDTALFRTPRDRGSAQHLAKIYHEKEILDLLGLACRLHDVQGGTMDGAVGLLSEDNGGVPLESLIEPGGLDLRVALWIAAGLADRLADAHARRIIHKDVNPAAVLVNLETRQVDLVSFGIASRLPRETNRIVNPAFLDGRLEFISPEQTGRMNRHIDYRTDFYSLGATLYAMLSGHPPFASDDPMELVHAHIARPLPPLPEQTPPVLVRLVERLLAKNAEDRYQSARGIAADLRRCLATFEPGRIEDFTLGADDRADVFQVPQRLYGRADEIRRLLDAFDQVADGGTRMMLVSGYSGIGKSALVHEVHKPIVARRGLFISGKFEQYRRDFPYLAFAEAFRELTRQLLTQSSAEVAALRERILGAVGEMAQVVIDVIPEVELLVGPQPPVPPVAPVEAEQRFAAVFQNFLRVFAGGDHPLVIFLDDLQWADPASLKLIRLLMGNRAGMRLFLVGAYRDNEVSPSHPLMLTLDDLREAGAPIDDIVLAPLTADNVAQLTADTLRMARLDCAELAQVLHAKTGGNPFFLRQFFEALYVEGHVRMVEGEWQWSREDIDGMESTANVVDLMVSRIRKLSDGTQDVLRWAAAIGAVFDLKTIAAITGQTRAAVAEQLWEAVRVGQVIPLSGAEIDEARALSDSLPNYVADLAQTYRFVHDRVQQAAYSMIETGDIERMHERIGRTLWESTGVNDVDEAMFDIVNHMNRCLALVDGEDRRRLAVLNINAAKRAKQSTAYEAALGYAHAADELLEGVSWDDDYDLRLELAAELAECEYLSGNFEVADGLFDQIIAKARDLAGRLLVYEKKVVLLRHKAEYEAALRAIVEGLALADIEVPWHDDAARIGEIVEADSVGLRERLAGRDVDTLIDLPTMTAAVDLAVMDLLAELSMLAYFFNPALVQLATVKMVTRSLESGNCRSSTVAYATYGMAIASGLGLYDDGYKFGRLSIRLAQKMNDVGAECIVRFWHGATICHWRAPVDEGIEVLKTGTEQAHQAGAPVYASYNSFFIPVHTMYRADNIRQAVDTHYRYVGLYEPQSLFASIAYRQEALCLLGELPGRGDYDGGLHVDGSPFVEADYVREMVDEKGLFLSEQHYYNSKQRAYVFFHRNEEALAMWDRANEKGRLEDIIFGQLTQVPWRFFRVMALTACADTADTETREAWLAEIDDHIGRLDMWAENCPDNFEAMRLLAHAEAPRTRASRYSSSRRTGRPVAPLRLPLFQADAAMSRWAHG